jgi:hypothetical protein
MSWKKRNNNMNRKPFLVGLIVGGLLGLIPGFGLGVYFLPIILAGDGADETVLAGASAAAERRGMFVRDLPGSDPLHYGDGEIIHSVENGETFITLQGRVTPGPDYKLYMTPKYVDTKAGFEDIKAQSVRVGDIKAFENFRLRAPSSVKADDYPAVPVWCEKFSMFINSAQLK